MSDFDTMAADPCQTVDSFAADMVAVATVTGHTVLGEFNQYTLEARPGMTRRDVMKPWDETQRASYFGVDR